MVDRVDVHRVGLLRHLIDDRNINQELIGGQDGLHTVHAESVLRDDDNPVDGRLGVRPLEYRSQTLHVKRALHLGGAEQHQFVGAGERRHVTRIIPGADELQRIGPRADLPEHVAGLSFRRPHVIEVVVHVDTPIAAQLGILDKLVAHGFE